MQIAPHRFISKKWRAWAIATILEYFKLDLGDRSLSGSPGGDRSHYL